MGNKMGKIIELDEKRNKNKIGNILLLENVFDEVVKNKDKGYTLFGQKGGLTSGKTIYDFFFHNIEGIFLDKRGDHPFLMIPILPYQYSKNSNKTKIKMYELFMKNKSINTFAIRDTTPKILNLKRGGKRNYKNSLCFFDIKQTGIGKEIYERDNYGVTSIKKCEEIFSNWKDFNISLSRVKSELKKEYKS
ncbi:hypothetical protein CMI39_03285 [Candidatus Pacearchaeota archaeon]|nr:hypothetical protein [Candidatus Pacearchaeota archaeon]